MASYAFLDTFLGLSSFAFTAWGCVLSIHHWERLFSDVRDSCRAGLEHPRRKNLLWLVPISIAIWLLAAGAYFRNIFAVRDLMTLSLRNGGKGSFAHAMMEIYFFLLIACGILSLYFTAWFVCDHKRNVADLVMIMKFNAANHDSLTDLEAQSNVMREPQHRGRPLDADPGFDSDGDAIRLTPSSLGSTEQNNNTRVRRPDFDEWYDVSNDSETCASCCSEHRMSVPSTRPALHREPLSPTTTTGSSEDCPSCCSEHRRSVPWTRPALHREPLSPTSTTGSSENCPSCCSEYRRSVPGTRLALNREPLSTGSTTGSSAPDASDADAEMTDHPPQRVLDPNRKREGGKHVRRHPENSRAFPSKEWGSDPVEHSEGTKSVQRTTGNPQHPNERSARSQAHQLPSSSSDDAAVTKRRPERQKASSLPGSSRDEADADESSNGSHKSDHSSSSDDAAPTRLSLTNRKAHKTTARTSHGPERE